MHPYPVLKRVCHLMESVLLHILTRHSSSSRWISHAAGRRYLLP
jgi:hypothetical protein